MSITIAFTCDSFQCQLGGSFLSTHRFAKELVKLGHNVVILAAKCGERFNKDFEIVDGIKVYRLKSFQVPNGEGTLFFTYATSREIANILRTEKVDIVHLTMLTTLWINTYRAAKLLSIPVVCHSHMQPENVLFHVPLLKNSQILSNLIYKCMVWFYKKAELTVCPTLAAQNKLTLYCPGLSTQVISNGVDIEKYTHTAPNDIVSKYHINPKKFAFLYVGRLHPEKNVQLIIEAAKLIPISYKNDISIHIIGEGYLEHTLKEMVSRYNLTNIVNIWGKVSDGDLIQFLSLDGAFVLPTFAELESMAVLEAMACGKPLLISNAKENAAQTFVKGNGYLFDPQKPEDLKDKMIMMLKNIEEVPEMSKKSRDTVQHFAIKSSAEKLIKLYQRFI